MSRICNESLEFFTLASSINVHQYDVSELSFSIELSGAAGDSKVSVGCRASCASPLSEFKSACVRRFLQRKNYKLVW